MTDYIAEPMSIVRADLGALYCRHAPAALRRARYLLGNDADAHDVVHDVFVSLLETPHQYTGRSKLTTFLNVATTHACFNRLRNQRTRLRLLRFRQLETRAQHKVIQPDVRVSLLSELNSMPEDAARMVVYYYLDGLTHDEIAALMRCSARRVGKLLTRARRTALEGL